MAAPNLNDDNVEQLPPQDLEAEQATLGAMLQTEAAVAEVADVLRPEHFYRPAHQIICETVLRLYGGGQPADAVTVNAELQRSGQLVRVGGAPYLHTLLAAVPTATNVGHYAERVADQAKRRDLLQHSVRIRQIALVESEVDTAVARARDELDELSSGPRGIGRRIDPLARIVNGAQLQRMTFAPLRFAVPGLVPEGLTLLAGAPKVGKSWVTLDMAISVATGRSVLGCLTVPRARPVLLCALEDGHRRLQDRTAALLGDADTWPPLLDLLNELDPGVAVEAVGQWLDRHQDRAPLVVIDTLAKVGLSRAQAGESAYAADYRAAGRWKRLVDDHPGSSIVLVHHTRKLHSEDFVDGVSGTAGIAGSCDTILILTRARTEDAAVLQVTGRDVSENAYALRKDERGQWTLEGGGLAEAARTAASVRAKAGLGDRSSEIYDKVLAAGPDGIGPKAIAEQLPDLDANQVSVYLGRLTEAGRIDKVGRGRYLVQQPDDPNGSNAPNRGLQLAVDPDDDQLPQDHVGTVGTVRSAGESDA